MRVAKCGLVLAAMLVAMNVAAFAGMQPTRLAGGTKIQLELTEQLKSGDSKEGQTVHYIVKGNVVDADRRIIIKDGAQAFGTVTRSKNHGMFGKKGKLDFTVEYAMAVDGTKVPLRSGQQAKGKSGTANVIGGVLLAGPAGFLLKGGNIVLKIGTAIPALVEKDTVVKVWTSTKKRSPARR